MNTTRGDQTDDVVDINNVKLVIISDKGFMVVPPFNTTMKKLEKTDDAHAKR